MTGEETTMFLPRGFTVSLILLGALLLGMTLMPLFSCTKLWQADASFWGTPGSTTNPAIVAIGGVNPGSPAGTTPPLLEVVAGVLATAGFGGMATWLNRVKSNGAAAVATVTATAEAHDAQIAQLVAQVAVLTTALGVKPPAPTS
jgi:hypothetical protein